MKHLLTTILLLINVFSCIAQNCNNNKDTIKTSNPYSLACTQANNSLLLAAQKMVTISNNTNSNVTIKNTSGYNFTIQTDNSIVVSTPGYLGSSQIVNGTTRTLDTKDYSPGSIGGTINVSSSGATNYNIPVIVPPGSHGMQPGLGISYSSKAGNGILGYGWQLSGLSKITRVSKNTYYNGQYAPISAKDSVYALDGQRLIYNSSKGTYSPENDPYTIVTLSGGYFTVTTQDGTVMTYGGNTLNVNDNSQFDVTWAIDEIKDPNGNYIQFNYIGSSGEYRINQILYTGNGSSQPYNKVEFYYQKRQDINTIYIAGIAVNQTLLLTEITTFAQNTIAQDYNFSYLYDGLYSKLNQILLTSDGITYNPTVINWGISNFNVLKPTILNKADWMGPFTYIMPGCNTGMYFGDFNGDGIPDYIVGNLCNDSLGVYIANDATGKSYTHYTLNLMNYADIQNPYLDLSVLDYKNDGKDEILLHYQYNQLNPSTGNYFQYDSVSVYSFNNTTGSFTRDSVSCEPITNSSVTAQDYQYLYADFKGDGKMDQLIVNTDNGVFLSLRSWTTPNETITKLNETINVITPIQAVKTLDFDGDGQMELLVIDNSYAATIWKYNINTSSFYCVKSIGIIANWEPWSEQNIAAVTGFTLIKPNVAGEIFIGDFNGDGKSDILFYNTNGGYDGAWNIWYSNGVGFTPVTGMLPSEFKNGLDPTIHTTSTFTSVLVTDLNNDGKSDIVLAVDDTIWLFISNGYSFILENKIIVDGCSGFSIGGNFINSKIVGNQQELIFAAFSCPDSGYYKEIDFTSELDNPLYVDAITDGNNIQSSVSYKTEYPSPSATVNVPVLPIKRALLPSYIVTRDLNTGAMISDITDSFANGYNHTTGKGFLGYQTYIVDNVLDHGTTQATSYNFTISDSLGNTPYFTWPSRQTTKTGGKTFVSESNYMRAKGGNAANKLFLPVTTTSITSEPIKGNYSITDSVKTFNLALGRVTDRISIASDGGTTADNNWQKETKISYNTISGYENVPGTIVSTSTLGTDIHTETTNYTFSSSFPFRVISKRYQGEISDTFNNFDSYGNITSETLKVIDGTPSRTVSCSYDSYGRFVTSSTDVVGNKSSATYRAIDGAPLSKTDPNGLSEIYNYSVGGNTEVTQITLPDGNIISDSTLWDQSGTALIKNSKGITNGNSVTDYINGIGQKIKGTTYGFNKKPLNCTYTYNLDGTINTVTDNSGIATTYSYKYPDETYRLYKITGLNTNLNYTYGSNPYAVTIFDSISGQVKTDTIDAIGNVTGISATTQNIHNSYYSSGKLKSMTNVSDGSVISMTYDPLLLTQLTLTDPDAGIKRYKYNGFGQITSQTDTLKSSIIAYDPFGRIQTNTQKDNNGNTNKTTYNYSYTPGTLELIQSIKRDSVSETYSYDGLCRPTSMTTSGPVVPGKAVTGTKFTTSMTYNNQGQVKSTSYPTGLTVNYSYDPVGNLSNIANAAGGNIWTGNNVDTLNQWTKYTLGNGLITTKTYNTSTYELSGISTGTSSNSGSIQNLGFNFNADGQLTRRSDNITSVTEGFNYDPFDRLTTDSLISTSVKHVTSYATNGNISSTTWGGKYTYDQKHIHAVDIISGVSSYKARTTTSDTITQCTYNADNQILTVNNGMYVDTFVYGANGDRFRVDMSKSGTPGLRKVYINNSEFGYNPSGTLMYGRTIIYAPTGVCAVFQDTIGSPSNLYYIHTDYLGSWLTITNSSGAVTNSYSYDAWGRPRNPKTWHADTITVNNALVSLSTYQPRFDYGYTGQEQMPGFGLINYNARLYDPYSQRFMNPDPDIQDPSNAQNLNRYTYCLNNPLKYIDPSGEDAEDNDGGDPSKKYHSKTDCRTQSSGPAKEPLLEKIGKFVTAVGKGIGAAANYIANSGSGGGSPSGGGSSIPDGGGGPKTSSQNSVQQNNQQSNTNVNPGGGGNTSGEGGGGKQVLMETANLTTFSSPCGVKPIVTSTFLKSIASSLFKVKDVNIFCNGEIEPNTGIILNSYGMYEDKEGNPCWGYTYHNNVYISPAAQNNPRKCLTTLAHELVHALNFKQGLDVDSPTGRSQSEHAAFSYEAVFARKVGWIDIAKQAEDDIFYNVEGSNPEKVDTNYDKFSLPFH